MNASVGIVVICRNNLEGVKQTIDSIRAQSSPADRVVIVDGNSTDGTTEWFATAGLPAYFDYASEPDAGIYDALNKGVERVGCDLILFTNGGDRLAQPDVLAVIRESFADHGWKWAYGDTRVEDTHGVYYGKNVLKYFARIRFLLGVTAVPHQGVIISQRLVDEIGGFRLDLGVSADQEHLLRAWMRSEPHYLDREIAIFDPFGVSSESDATAFASQMRSHRALNRVKVGGSALSDIVAYYTARTLLSARHCVNQVLRRRKASV